MSIYQDIYDAQRSQGYMGGKKGATYGKYKDGKAKEHKEKKESEKAKYSVTIHSGQVYKSTDSNGLSDPYVRICKNNLLGRTLMETPVQHKTLSPSWEYTGEFSLSKEKGKNAEVNIVLLDKDMVGSDKVGEYTFSLGSSGKNETVSFYVDKDGKKMINGQITLTYKKL
eukprot:Phypoly_transcript_17180.p1 GENE.Phypoly_transcript_17180~~Phypoly_transcript_17180.p1  ORF type:complete len:169 (+),score=38.72 Phypoly_transcript_17180:277-783(+)